MENFSFIFAFQKFWSHEMFQVFLLYGIHARFCSPSCLLWAWCCVIYLALIILDIDPWKKKWENTAKHCLHYLVSRLLLSCQQTAWRVGSKLHLIIHMRKICELHWVLLQPCKYRSWLIQFSDVRIFVFCLLATISDINNRSFIRIFLYLLRLIVCFISNVSGHSNYKYIFYRLFAFKTFYLY